MVLRILHLALLLAAAAWSAAAGSDHGVLRVRLHRVVTAAHALQAGGRRTTQPVSPPGDEQLLNFKDRCVGFPRVASWALPCGGCFRRPPPWLSPRRLTCSQYFGMMGVGTPPQWFTVLADTGSPVTWLPAAAWCASKRGCDGHHGFNASLSSTCVPGDATVQVEYGDGTGVTGSFVSDTVVLTGLQVPGVQLALVTAGTAPASGVFDGLIGLGLAQNVPPGLVQIALSQGLLAQPLFGVWLNQNPLQPQDGGELVLGGTDPAKMDGPLVWANVTSNNLGGWPVPLDGVFVGGVSVACGPQPCVAAIDTGTSLILGPPAAVDAIYAAINAALRGVGGITCAEAARRMPTVAFGLGGARLELTPEQYLRRDAAGGLTCEASFGSVTFSGVAPGYPTWLLGDTFLGAYYTVFDVATQSVGFARAVPSPHVTRHEAWVIHLLLWRFALLALAAAASYAVVVEWERQQQAARREGGGGGGGLAAWVAGDVERG